MTISGKAGRSTRQDMPNCLPAEAVFQEFTLLGFLVGDYIRGLDIPSVVSPGADEINFAGLQLADRHFVSEIDEMQIHDIFYYLLNVGVPLSPGYDIPQADISEIQFAIRRQQLLPMYIKLMISEESSLA